MQDHVICTGGGPRVDAKVSATVEPEKGLEFRTAKITSGAASPDRETAMKPTKSVRHGRAPRK